jgi:hypothetical protein
MTRKITVELTEMELTLICDALGSFSNELCDEMVMTTKAAESNRGNLSPLDSKVFIKRAIGVNIASSLLLRLIDKVPKSKDEKTEGLEELREEANHNLSETSKLLEALEACGASIEIEP